MAEGFTHVLHNTPLAISLSDDIQLAGDLSECRIHLPKADLPDPSGIVQREPGTASCGNGHSGHLRHPPMMERA